jgi:hypothetical protein
MALPQRASADHCRVVWLHIVAVGCCWAVVAGQGECIYTVAGTGAAGYSGDGGLGTAAQLNRPAGMIAAPGGGVWFIDQFNHRIRSLSTSGVITTVAGTGAAGFDGDGGPAVSAKLNQPFGMSATADGGAWVADTHNHRVRRIWPDGTIITLAGTGSAGFSGDGSFAISAVLYYPAGVATAPDGGTWIADNYNHRIRRLWVNGIITTVAGTGTAGFGGDGNQGVSAQLRLPLGLSPAPGGGVWVADTHNHRVRRLWVDGSITTAVGTGSCVAAGDGGPATAANICYPHDVFAASDGGLWIVDHGNHRLRRMWANGNITTVAGTSGGAGFSGDGGASIHAQLDSPAGACETAGGHAWVADQFNHRIRRILPAHMCGERGLGALSSCSGTSASAFVCSVAGLAHVPPLTASTSFGPCSTQQHPTYASDGIGTVSCPAAGLQQRCALALTWTLPMGSRSALVSLCTPTAVMVVSAPASAAAWHTASIVLTGCVDCGDLTAMLLTHAAGAVSPAVPCFNLTVLANQSSTTVSCALPLLLERWLSLPAAAADRVVGMRLGFGGNYTSSLPLLVAPTAAVARPTATLTAPTVWYTSAPSTVRLAVSPPALLVGPAWSLPADAVCNGTASTVRCWVGGSACAAYAWLNATAVACTPAGNMPPWPLARAVVELCGLWNATSDGEHPAAPIDTGRLHAYVTVDPTPGLAAAAATAPPQVAAAAGRNITLPLPPSLQGAGVAEQLAVVATRLWLNGTACPALRWGGAGVTCVNWSLPLPPDAYGAGVDGVFSVAVEAEVRGLRLAAGALRLAALPRVAEVRPAVAAPGTCVTVVGDWFVASSGADVRVSVGGLPCSNITHPSPSNVSCCLPPVIPLDTAGYPRLRVAVSNERGSSVDDVTLTVPAEAGTSLVGDASPRIVQSSPQDGGGPLFVIAPPLAARTSGSGVARCAAAVSSWACPSPTAAYGSPFTTDAITPLLVGVTAAADTAELTVDVPSANVTLVGVGVRARAGCVVNVTARCTDGLGRATTAPGVVVVAVVDMAAAWSPCVAAAMDATPGSPLPPANATITLLRGGSGVAAPAGAASGFACVSAVVAAAAPPPLSQPLAALSSPLAAAPCTVANDSLAVACPSLALSESMPLGSALLRLVECTWAVTGERLRLAPIAVAVTNVSVATSVAWLKVVSGLAAGINVTLTPSWHAAPPPPAAASCVLEEVGVRGPLTLTAGTVTGVAWGGGVALPLTVTGPPSVSVQVRARCTVWGQSVASPPVAVSTAALRVEVVSEPASPFVPSVSSAPWLLAPVLTVRVTSPAVAEAILDVSCAVSVRGGAGFSLIPMNGESADVAFAGRTPGANGSVAFPVFGLVGEYAADGGARTATLAVTCTREGGSPPAATVSLTALPARAVMCVPPAGASTSQAALPRFTVGVALGAAAAGSETVARAAACATTPPQPPPVSAWPPLTCRITEANASATGSSSDVLLQGAGTFVPQSQPLLAAFTSFAVSAPPGATYGLRVACSLGEVAVPPALDFAVALASCVPGAQIAGIFCQPCGAGNWSAGTDAGVRQEYRRCRGCPPSGADCTGGVLTLRPHFHRPQRHVVERLPLGPDAELWPCWNGEACVVYNATDNATHSCTVGYAGALCGVCDAAAGYGRFGEVCAPCWSRGASEAFLAAIIVVVVGVMGWFALRRSDGVKSPASIVLKITLSFLQVRVWGRKGG